MAKAVIGIAGKIIANLVPEAVEKVGKLCGIKHEHEALRDTVSTLLAMLDAAEEQYHQMQVRVDQLIEAFYDAHDVLEEFNIEAMRRELRGHSKMMKEADKGFHFDEYPKGEPRKREETHSFIREGEIRERDEDKKAVMEFLLDSDVQENVSILPIVGFGGIGKTALAQCVYNDEMVSKQFNLKMWVSVSDDFDMKKIVKNMIVCAKKKEPTEVAMEQLQSELKEEIDGKRHLLVLDDLWNKNRETWLLLKTLLSRGARGSKILITTRLRLVAEITGTTPPHFLKGLSESASLDLLMQMAYQKIEEIQDLDMLAIDYEIKKQTLVNLWMAEGFFEPSKRSQDLEDIFHGYFIDLLWSNFFQDLQTDSFTNKDTCKMPSLMHDLACSVARSECDPRISHLKASSLRTFLSVPTSHEMEQRDPTTEVDLCQLIQSFKRLRILDMDALIVKKVPRSIGRLKHVAT
ncbi:putative disease resistance protein RGA4 [Syzygium oleosum]|uniref:putative disease resistance protein RGA4 n=1 Tax=Syzygium oleosum TaxID=219896 RepID=UPI0024BBE893|nr:putative disease resistance protein RGA4 [Syzygium oleosum]